MVWIPWMMGWALWLAPSPQVCRVHVEGMPAPQLRHHVLQVGTKRVVAGPETEVPATPGGIVVLQGPRYRGEVRLPASCEEPVVLKATPLPARLQVTGTPPKAVLSCRDCPGLDSSTNFLATTFVTVAVEAWSTEVTLWIRAAGYEPRRYTVVLHPGPNAVEVSMSLRS